jgi:general secretion pathway protein A
MASNLPPVRKEPLPQRRGYYSSLLAHQGRCYGSSRMYWQFYDLTHDPFQLTADPACFFPSPRHEDALATLIDSLHQHQGMVALLGDAGLGKTLLLHVYLALARQRQYRTVQIGDTGLTFRELWQRLYQALELDFTRATLDVFLAACQHQPVILGLDDAHLIPTLIFKKLWLLVEHAASVGAVLHIVLAGRPELALKLDALALHHLTPGPVLRYTLSPFTPEESKAFIYHRLTSATSQVETVFTSRALTRIIKVARGVPDTLNALCTQALLAGFWARHRPVSARAAREAIAQVQDTR